MILFIYGTLRAGGENHHLLGDARFCGPAQTLPQYTLVSLGWYPGIAQTGSQTVHGELWEVDSSQLETLDAYEGPWFERHPIALAAADAPSGEPAPPQPVQCWFIRLEMAAGRPVIASGDFLNP